MAHSFARIAAQVRRLVRARDGATAVEFALIATPFFLLLMGILELALVFLVSTTLEHATQDAARMIRTGEFQAEGNVTADDFENLVCDRLVLLGDACKAQLDVDVRAYANLKEMVTAQADNEYDPEETCFEAGGPREVVLVRTSIRWKIFTPLLAPSMASAGDGKRLIRSTTAFKNEPYLGEAPASACA
ncbi:MAG: TadE/TadG family type IV pilus assembly protein [Phenylobacterium sp.]|uniref:TadE/TadG family type IV pilus assembly protein n=1 Tax=Phenylobacterium sp. TaxID=1871053 RepID=UPI003561E1BC